MSRKPTKPPAPKQDYLPKKPRKPHARKPKTQAAAPDTTQTLMLRRQVLELSRAGYRCPEIAAQMGRHRSWIFKILQAALDDVREEIRAVADEVRAIELDRLDALMTTLWMRANAATPDYQAIDRVLKIMERRARLLGLDAPIRVTTPVDQPFELAMTQAVAQPLHSEDLTLYTSEQLAGLYRQRINEAYEADKAKGGPAGTNVVALPRTLPVAG